MKSYENDVTTEVETSLKANSYGTEVETTKLSSNPVLTASHIPQKSVVGSNESKNQEKLINRDSGFHTMTRHPFPDEASNNLTSTTVSINGVTSQTNAVKRNDSLNSDAEKEYRSRSSPIIKRKTFKFSSKGLEDEEAQDLALKLFNLEGKDKREVAKHLTNQDDFSLKVAATYMELFNFTSMNLDEAMRLLLKRLALLGETQERERLLHHFACRYNQCNPKFLDGDLDALHILVCAIALLNTDLHGAKVGGRRRMTKKQFINNLAGVTKKGHDIPTPLLKDMYRSISKHPLPWCEQTSDKPSASISKSPSLLAENKTKKSKIVLRSQSMNQPSHHKIRPLPVYPDDNGRKVGACRASKFKTIPRKQGVLWRKTIVESDGSKTPKRKRRWKLVVVALQGLEFHIAKKDSHDAVKVSLHHSLAEVEASHSATKRHNVFRLLLANKSVTLYQTSSREEQKLWVRAINRNAALLSAAPLSAGVGSQVKFQCPLLPSANSTLPLANQLEEQQNRLDDLCNELDEHRKNSPQVGAKTVEKQYHKDKENYLLHEIQKYEVYTNSLSELVSAERQYVAQREKLNAVADRRSADAQSLLSVSPSEPGVGQNLSSYPSTENTGSVGDLVDRVKPKYNRLRAVSSLSPTSSLPNLHPLSVDPSPMRRGLLRKENSSSYSDSSPLSSLPVVSEGDSSATQPPPPHPELSTSMNENNCNNKNFNPRFAMGQSKVTKQSSFVGTSYLSKDAVQSKKQVFRASESPFTFRSHPRMKGRKERKGSSRYSYLHAVNNLSQM